MILHVERFGVRPNQEAQNKIAERGKIIWECSLLAKLEIMETDNQIMEVRKRSGI